MFETGSFYTSTITCFKNRTLVLRDTCCVKHSIQYRACITHHLELSPDCRANGDSCQKNGVAGVKGAGELCHNPVALSTSIVRAVKCIGSHGNISYGSDADRTEILGVGKPPILCYGMDSFAVSMPNVCVACQSSLL